MLGSVGGACGVLGSVGRACGVLGSVGRACDAASSTESIVFVSIFWVRFNHEEQTEKEKEQKRKRMCLRFKTFDVFSIWEIVSAALSSHSS